MIKKIIMAILVIALVCPYAYADGVGKVTYVEGRVDSSARGSDSASALREGDIVSIGDAIRTKSNSKAEITFNDKSVVRLAQNTRIEVKDYVLDGNNKRKTADIMLDRGKTRTIIAKMPDKADFVISTPNAKGVVKGSDVFAFYQAGNSGMLVSEGRLSLISMAHPEKEITVFAGTSILVPLDELPKDPRAYLDIEKKFHEQDTFVPPSIVKRERATEIKGFLTKLSGDVRITSKGTASSHAANLSEILSEGDLIETGENGKVEIRFDNGNGMNLKPNSKVLIVKLVIDLKTGEYENKFESSMGSIRSRIENLKGKSVFEVKTPTAVCGARGTIMYTNVLPGMTKTYFDGGNGYIQSILNGMKKVIGAGQNGSSDGGGNLTGPNDTTGDEQNSNDEGWDPGNGTEGYSSPGGNTGGFTGGDTGGGTNLLGTGIGGGTNTSTDVPFTTVFGMGGGSSSGGTTTSTTFTDDFSGKFGTISLSSGLPIFTEAAGSSMTGTATSTQDMASQWSGTLASAMSGTVNNGGSASDIVRGTTDGAANTGGKILGWVGGIGFSGEWKGAIASLYIDPSGTAGTMFSGVLSGTSAGGAVSTYTGSGDISIISMEATAIAPADLGASIVADTISGELDAVFAGGTFTTPFSRDIKNIDGMSWGIWQDLYKGTYQNTTGLASWSTTGGGEYNGSGAGASDGYVISTFEGEDDLAGMLRVDVMASYLTYKLYGAYSGSIIGEYTGTAIDGIGFGTWSEEGLKWSADAVTGYRSFQYYSSATGKMISDSSSSFTAIIGSTVSPFASLDNPVETHLMGKMTPNGRSTLFGRLNGSYADDSVIPRGYVIGNLSSADSIDGGIASIYINENGNAGTLYGAFQGDYYSSVDMWDGTGDVTATERAGGYDPTSCDYGNTTILGHLDGSFTGGGTITNSSDIRYMYSSASYSKATYLELAGVPEDWGAFNLELCGSYTGANDDWTLNLGGKTWGSSGDYWIAAVDGSKWSDSLIAGSITGQYLTLTKIGTIEGLVRGDYGSTNWGAVGTGIWSEKDLVWSADTTLGIFHYYSTTTNKAASDSSSFFYGIIGSLLSPFTTVGQSIEAVFMGEMVTNDRNTFFSRLNGGYADNSAIPRGYISGSVSATNSVNGSVASIYIDEKGNAGVLEGDFSGDYYPVLNMWEATGNIAATQRATGYDPASADYSNTTIRGYLNGSFTGGGTITNSADIRYMYSSASYSKATYLTLGSVSENWGVFNIELCGIFASPNDSWKIALSGNTWNRSSEYWFATVNGDKWSNDEVSGALEGVWIESAGGSDVRIGTISGKTHGSYIDVPAEHTWQAAAVGEWVEDSELLNQNTMFGADGLSKLNDFVNVPITEVYSNLLTAGAGACTGGVTSAAMNINMYAVNPADLNGIWTALINGTYNTASPVSPTWSANVTNGTDNVVLQGTQWNTATNQWVANVTGAVGGNNITNGQAGGTIDNDGTFTGAGAGTWEKST